jgi:hypothetical protein
VHWTIAAWLAGEACHLFAHGRDSGLLDLMLCTPLKIKEIVDGHVMGLKRVVYAPVATLVAVEGILLAAHVYVMAESGASSGRCAFVAVFVLFTIAAVLLDLAAVTQYGLWQGLKTRKSTRAVTKTVLYVLVFPLGIVCLGGPILLLLKNLILMNHAHQQLKRTFRPLVTGRYGWGDESEFIGQPSRAAMRGRMPPVLMR